MAKRSKQFSFQIPGFRKPSDKFGGSLLKSHAKCKRPLDSKYPIHVVLRANKGGMRNPLKFKTVNDTVRRLTKKYGIRVYGYANVGNHLHLLIKLSHINRWSSFIREVSGQVAQVVQGNSGLKLEGKRESFWKHRPFTRIVRSWNKAFRSVKEYIHLNLLEAEGFISRAEIKTFKDLKKIWGEASDYGESSA